MKFALALIAVIGLSGCCCHGFLGYRQVTVTPDVVFIDAPPTPPLTKSQVHMLRNAHPNEVGIYPAVALCGEPAYQEVP